jgi:peptidoglycan hydrolase-like protein with peptidoglycan-binding domain
MALSIVKIDRLPLGRRILRSGCTGRDVIELQKQLNQAGFYFGKQDGVFGILMGEAVTMFQKTFHLKVDGVAGREVLNTLEKNGLTKGRIIYRVEKNEELGKISERFGVKKFAWRRIPGQGNPYKKIYPGLKMLLHQKAFFCWDTPDRIEHNLVNGSPNPSPASITGLLCRGYQLETDGGLKQPALQSTKTKNFYYPIGAQGDVWPKILASSEIWPRLVTELKKMMGLKFGFDLREAPLNKIIYWKRFLKFICCNLNLPELTFLMLPLPVGTKIENRLYWLNIHAICAWARHIMIEPRYNMENPLQFERTAAHIFKELRHLEKAGLAEKTLIISQAAGWDWNVDRNCHKKVSYKVAKLIRAQYPRVGRYSSGSKCTMLNYLKNNEHHCLIYRDEAGWLDFFTKVIERNLAGVVITDFNHLGKSGPEIISGSFKVIEEENFG